MSDEEANVTAEELRRTMRYISHQRPMVEGRCAICDKPFRGLSTRMYCSNKCAARAYRRNHKATADHVAE